MKKKLTAEEKAALQARKIVLEQSIPTLKAQDPENDAAIAAQLQAEQSELDSIDSRLTADELLTSNANLEQAVLAARTKDADTAVKAAVKRGAIPAKNTELQQRWKDKCIEDPGNIEMLNAIPGSPALQAQGQRITLSGVQVMRESTDSVVRAYAAERDPKKKGLLYASEISKRVKEGDPIPLRAATNTLGTVAGEIVTQATLELLEPALPMLGAFATDFSAEAVVFNKEINSRIVGIPGTSSYNAGGAGTGYSTEDTVFTDVPVTIDEHKSCQVSFNVEEMASTSRKLFDEIAPGQAYAIANDLVTKALSVITIGNFTNPAIDKALIDFGLKTVTAIGGALSDLGVPTLNRTLLLKGDYFDELFDDDTLALLAANQRESLITGAEMIPLRGFNVTRTPTLPATGNLKGFGMSKSAIVIAARVPGDYRAALPGVSGGGFNQIITNTKTGMSVMLTQFVNDQLGSAFSRMAYMFGAAPGQAKCGQILRSAAP